MGKSTYAQTTPTRHPDASLAPTQPPPAPRKHRQWTHPANVRGRLRPRHLFPDNHSRNQGLRLTPGTRVVYQAPKDATGYSAYRLEFVVTTVFERVNDLTAFKANLITEGRKHSGKEYAFLHKYVWDIRGPAQDYWRVFAPDATRLDCSHSVPVYRCGYQE